MFVHFQRYFSFQRPPDTPIVITQYLMQLDLDAELIISQTNINTHIAIMNIMEVEPDLYILSIKLNLIK